MPGLTKGEKERFERFLKSLPPERKKALYARFRRMGDEERNDAIRKILGKVSRGTSATPKKNAGQGTSPKADPKKIHNTRSRGNPVPKANPPKGANASSQPRKPEKTQTRPNFNRIVNVLTVIVVLGCLMTLVMSYLTNREEIHSLFAKDTVETSETSETSSSEDETSETSSEVTSDKTSVTEDTGAESGSSATPTPVQVKEDAPDLSGFSIVIDPMHQAKTSENNETLLPNKDAFKAAATEGGKGVKTGTSESELVLQYALCAKEYLEKCGAKVVLTRTTNDIDLSNQDRARIATSSDCDIYLRLEAKCAEDPALTGVRVCIPEYGKGKSRDFSIAKDLAKAIASAEGLDDGGAATSMAYTGLNYATSVSAFQLNLGFLSNENDETILTDSGNIYNVAVCLSEFCDSIK